jgi:subtilase family serine protease
MKLHLAVAAVWMGIGYLLPAFAGPAFAGGEEQRHYEVLVPESAGVSPMDRGIRSHTRLRVLVLPDFLPSTTSQINTPAMLRSVYNLPSTGGSGAIAIVDAYHFPTALADFNSFSKYFGLPQETSTVATAAGNKTFQVVYAPGYQPKSGGSYIASWNLEAALDIEWAHAMAPNAKIYLVEAASDSTSDLDYAVRVAATLTGVKEVSMSWGGSELSYEAMFYDSIFTAPGLVYLASGGDSSDQMNYPAASPNVVSCGGTSVNRSTSGVFLSETGWNDTGCGPSAYEPRPGYQNGVASVVGTKRGVSDLSFDSNPNTGVYVYDSTPLWGESGWWILGGTSVASPSLAGVLNLAASSGNGFAASTAAEQARIYGSLGNAKAFRDITSGTDGKYSCKAGYDFITGVGSPNGLVGK